MAGAATAETPPKPGGTGTPNERPAANAKRSWRHSPAVRIGLPVAYLVLSVVAAVLLGLPYSQDWIFIWIVGLMLCVSVGATMAEHSARQLVIDWLPIIVALLAYDLLRGVADGNVFPIHYRLPIEADKVIGFGQVPTVRFQDAIYTAGHLHFWDYTAFSFWFSHFFGALVCGVCLWLFAYRWFHRFAACIVVLAALGLITYVVFPAAPPWLASDKGYLPHVPRITHAVVNHLPIPKASAAFQHGTQWGNDVAAVPSLHAGYTMLICLFLWPRIDKRWRPLLVAYPIGMGLSLIYLGEHYAIDILLGWVYAGATILIVNWGAERRAERRQQRAGSPAAAAAR